MSFLNPNPPVIADAVRDGRALFFEWGPPAYQSAPAGQFTLQSYGNTAAFAAPTRVGNQVAVDYSTTNAITRIARECRRQSAGAANSLGFYQIASSLISGAVIFPGVSGDGGFTIKQLAGFDAVLTAAQADCQMLIGCGAGGGFQVPSSGTLLTAAAESWFGLYVNGAAIGIGYKNAGGAIQQLRDLSSFGLWGAYKAFRVTVNVSPNGPTINYSAEYMNQNSTQFLPLANGSLVGGWNPGRNQIAPQCNVWKSVAAGGVDLWMSSVQITALVQGRISA